MRQQDLPKYSLPTGCDSTVYTQIIVESQPTVNQTITGCDQVVYNGQTYTSSTTVTEIYQALDVTPYAYRHSSQ